MDARPGVSRCAGPGDCPQAEPKTLGRHLDQALESIRLCASDPLCAEHRPNSYSLTLHGAACHACLFLPETSCERGNKYLDRSVLVKTLENDDVAFFEIVNDAEVSNDNVQAQEV